jgi:alanine-glyoxylate transaminase/serine-glyoxylate transaminase/serine-pyruvate transaminase
MSLRFGRALVAIPGPSIIPDRVLDAMRTPMPNIYDGELLDVSAEVLDRLPAIADTTGHAFMLIGNGHAGWEMVIANTLNRGDKVLVLDSGRFPLMWGEAVKFAGVETEVLTGTPFGPVDPAALEARLAAGPADEFAAVIGVHVDTANSVRNDVAALRRAIDASGSSALFMIDGIAALGCDEYHMDAWGVDVTVGASQKGLMTPPGVALVWANERAVQRGNGNDLRLRYLDWDSRINAEQVYQNYGGTPPVSHLYALREALRMIDEEGGLPAVWARHQVLADAVRAAADAWAIPDGIALCIEDLNARANGVTTLHSGSVDALELARRCEQGAGLTIGRGVLAPEHMFRIGHMGHVNPPSVMGTLGTIEAALRSMDAPLGGSGLAAAATVIADGLR